VIIIIAATETSVPAVTPTEADQHNLQQDHGLAAVAEGDNSVRFDSCFRTGQYGDFWVEW